MVVGTRHTIYSTLLYRLSAEKNVVLDIVASIPPTQRTSTSSRRIQNSDPRNQGIKSSTMTQYVRQKIGAWIVVLLGTFLESQTAVESMVVMTTGGGSGDYGSLRSRIECAQCELLVSVGRIPGTAMPPEWAASGARLGFPLEVEFTDETCGDYQMTKERLLGTNNGSNFRSVEPLNEPTFVSTKGQENVKVTAGAYGYELQQVEAQQYSFRFFLDFPDGAVRNDVQLPAERIYFMSSCWIIDDDKVLDRARQRRQDVESTLELVQGKLQELETTSTGILQKAMGFRESVSLVEKRDALNAQLFEIVQSYPLDSTKVVQGPNGVTFAKDGIIAVKRFRGTLGTREQYHWVGTFKITEFFDDEYEDDDDEVV